MAHILSKYPLTAEQRKQHGVPEPPKLVPVVFERCGHRAQVFEHIASGAVRIDDYCPLCRRRRS